MNIGDNVCPMNTVEKNEKWQCQMKIGVATLQRVTFFQTF